MEDPLLRLRRISNPARVWFYTKDQKRVLLLGDIHTQQVRECTSCEAPSCFDYVHLLKGLEIYHKETNTDLDVYIETFAPEHPERFFSRVKKASLNWLDLTYRHLVRQSLNLQTARTKFLPKLVFHGRKEGVGQRFHYIDFRLTKLFYGSGFELNTLFTLAGSKKTEEEKSELLDEYTRKLKQRYPTKADIRKAILTLLFAKSLPRSFKNRSVLKRGKTRIAKQFYKIPSKDEQKLVRSFASEELDTLLKGLDYSDKEDTIHYMLLILTMATDIYAISRFLRFFHQQVPKSTSVFLAGANHTERYARFLKEWSAKQQFASKRVSLSKTLKHSKCIKVNLLRKTRRKKE